MTKMGNNTSNLVVDGTIGKLSDELQYANVSFYASKNELDYIIKVIERKMKGDAPLLFIFGIEGKKIETFDIYTHELCLSFEHKGLLKLLKDNQNSKVIMGWVNEIEMPNGANNPVVQIGLSIHEHVSNNSDVFEKEDYEGASLPSIDNEECGDDDYIETCSIEDVWVKGYAHLTVLEKKYIAENVEVGDFVFLRNEFDNPVDKNALLVLHNGIKIGYVQAHKAEMIHNLLRNYKIRHIEISSIQPADDGGIFINLDVYYEDRYGVEEVPLYPIVSSYSVVEKDLFPGLDLNKKQILYPELYDYKEWYETICTHQLCYRFISDLDSLAMDERVVIDSEFEFFVSSYLDGTKVTRPNPEKDFYRLKTECAKKNLAKRIESYMRCMGYAFK